jgi:hypothetical protein
MTAGIANTIPAIFVSGGFIMPATKCICPSCHNTDENFYLNIHRFSFMYSF